MLTEFSEADIRSFEPELKIGLLATINPQGLPHLTLISSIKAGSPTTLTWGQFTEGVSKQHVRENPKTGWLVMSLARDLWRGKAVWTHAAKSGPDFDWYNNIPMFRYNAYFGIHTVHYMDLVEHTGKGALPMNRIIFAAVRSMIARTLSPARDSGQVFNAWTRAFFSKLDNLKFLAYVQSDGFPQIIPLIQAQADGGDRLIFSTGAYGDELRQIPAGTPVAVLGMALTMEDVLVRGEFGGLRRRAGLECGSVTVNWVYNPMPPKPQQIYPPLELRAVTEF